MLEDIGAMKKKQGNNVDPKILEALKQTLIKWIDIRKWMHMLNGELIGRMCPLCHIVIKSPITETPCDNCPAQHLCNGLQDGYFKEQRTIYSHFSGDYNDLLNILDIGIDKLLAVYIQAGGSRDDLEGGE